MQNLLFRKGFAYSAFGYVSTARRRYADVHAVYWDHAEAHLRRSGVGVTPDVGRRKLSGLYASFSGGGSFICMAAPQSLLLSVVHWRPYLWAQNLGPASRACFQALFAGDAERL